MLALLPFAAFATGFWLLWYCLKREWREAFLFAAIGWAGLVAVSSEALSLLTLLHRLSIALFWSGVILVLVLLCWRYKPVGSFRLPADPRQALGFFSPSDRLLLSFVVVYVVVLAGVSWVAPPNTNDSLQYHLSRVMHWSQNGSLTHYATPVDRQIWMPIWSETAILHLLVLAGNDRLATFVQWFSMVASLVGVSMIAGQLASRRNSQVLAVIFCVTIPMGILQASSTQTDYVTAFWLVCVAYFTNLAGRRSLAAHEWVLLSASVGLGVLTKGTFYLFVLPWLVWLLVVTVRRMGLAFSGRYAFLGAAMVVTLNLGVWGRNLQTYASPLGEVSGLTNSVFTPAALLSNIIRNATLHLGTPYGVVNGPLTQGVELLHRFIGQDVHDARTTYDPPYRVKRYLHEDRAGNPWHFLLIGASLLALGAIPSGKRRIIVVFAIAALSGFVLYSALYKWQSTGSRLQLPFFVVCAPMAGAIFSQPVFSRVRIGLSGMLLFAGLWPLLANPSRPIIPFEEIPSILRTPRDELLFVNSPEVKLFYLSLIQDIQDSQCRSLGLSLDSHDIEYPFWALLAPSGNEMRIEHLRVVEPLQRYIDPDFSYCALVCKGCSFEGEALSGGRARQHGEYTLLLVTGEDPGEP